jgi:hypothetical protein
MKKRIAITNLCLMITVLFAMLFQSFHSYEHLAKQLSEKHCEHKYHSNKTEFSHQHNSFDTCFVCEFTFSSVIAPENVSFDCFSVPVAIPYSFAFSETILSFSGSLYSLRGPPIGIV